MGIEGFHPIIKPYLRPTDLTEFRGKKLAVDASAWLHRGIFSSAADIFRGNLWWNERGVDPPYVDFCLKMATDGLLSKGISPVFVFDGAPSPMKADEKQRRAGMYSG